MLFRKKEKSGEKIRSRVHISFHICRVSACDLCSAVRTDNVTLPFSIFAWPVTIGSFKSLKKSSCSRLIILFVHLRKRNRSYVVIRKLWAWQEILVWTARDFFALSFSYAGSSVSFRRRVRLFCFLEFYVSWNLNWIYPQLSHQSGTDRA